jgi:acetyl esterase
MLDALKSWLAGLHQVIWVGAFRRFYRLGGAWNWRGQSTDIVFSDIRIPAAAGSIGARLYSSQQGAEKPLIVYIHGGGWVIGDLESHHHFCIALSDASHCTVVALDYRLAPEYPFPAGQDDCLAAIDWLAKNARDVVLCNGQLIVAGDSAGGNIAACVCLELGESSRQKIKGEILIYPATDHYSAGSGSYVVKAKGQLLTTKRTVRFWDTYLQQRTGAEPEVQRAFPKRSDNLAALPPTLLITAENDPLRDEGRAYAEQLEKADVAVTYHHFDTAEHGFACSDGPTEDHRLFMRQLKEWLAQLH